MIKTINKLEDLVDSFVPEKIIEDSPQFYNIIKAFLANIQRVQESINSNFMDCIDYTKINNPEFKRIILKTYLGTLRHDLIEDSNLYAINDALRISKGLSILKGTSLLYEILIRLLLYIIPGVGTYYNLLLAEYNDETTSIDRKNEIQEELNIIQYNNYIEGLVTIEEKFDTEENIIPFNYVVIADLDVILYNTYIKPFAHISGWEEEFIQGINKILVDYVEVYEATLLYDTFDFPLALGDGTFEATASGMGFFPNTSFTDALLGLEEDYDSIISKFTDTSNIYISEGNVYYKWDDFLETETYIGTNTSNEKNVLIKSPCYNSIIPTGGSYLGDTTDIAKGNGMLNGGMLNFTHRIIYQKGKSI